jgi:uncharacterized protein with HEPN domain
MRPESRDPAYLWNMVDAARTAQEIAGETSYEAFLADRVRRLAMERAIEIIGEAAQRVSETLKQAHPEIPWSSIVGQRNVIVHQYTRIDYVRIWEVATTHAPELIRQIEPLLPPIEED